MQGVCVNNVICESGKERTRKDCVSIGTNMGILWLFVMNVGTKNLMRLVVCVTVAILNLGGERKLALSLTVGHDIGITAKNVVRWIVLIRGEVYVSGVILDYTAGIMASKSTSASVNGI